MPTNDTKNAQTNDAAIVEIFEGLLDWYTERMEKIASVHGADPLTIDIGGGKKLTITGQDLTYFRLGLSVAEQMIGKFPLKIELSDDDEDDEEATCQ